MKSDKIFMWSYIVVFVIFFNESMNLIVHEKFTEPVSIFTFVATAMLLVLSIYYIVRVFKNN